MKSKWYALQSDKFIPTTHYLEMQKYFKDIKQNGCTDMYGYDGINYIVFKSNSNRIRLIFQTIKHNLRFKKYVKVKLRKFKPYGKSFPFIIHISGDNNSIFYNIK